MTEPVVGLNGTGFDAEFHHSNRGRGVPALDDRLLASARDAQARAYAPYSGCAIGAAVATPDGTIFIGCNVENASFPVGTCAEAGAIAAMVAAGYTRIDRILVIGGGREPITPCGACRQRIREFATGSTMVDAVGLDGVRRRFPIDALLPHAFGPAHLRSST